MARILSGNAHKRVGQPGWRIASMAGRGARVAADKASKLSVRRLFARNPADGSFANFGTEKDILGFTNDPDIPNTTAAPKPTIMNGSQVARNSTPVGRIGVRNRATNRRITRR